MAKYFTASRIAKLGIFSALATILYLLGFPLPFFPEFLALNFSDLPVLICGFVMGPVSAVIVLLIKILMKLLILGTFTGGVGELADFLIGLAFVLPSALIYMKQKTKKRALAGMFIGACSSIVVAMLTNWLVLIPLYAKLLMPMETIIGMCAKVMPFINADNFYVCYLFIAVLPFNILRCLIAVLITYFVYKRISTLFKKF